MNTKDTKSGRGIFKPRARIMRTIGDELISNDAVALIELVKNAYDADATKVLVRFNSPLEEGKGCIEVFDNGHGMSLETILNTWLEPATNYRKREQKSKEFNRRVLGEKGVGRFAAARLANELVIITREETMDHEVLAKFKWKRFDDETKYLSDVKIPWSQIAPKYLIDGGMIEALRDINDTDSKYQHGTVMLLKKLRSTWKDDEFRNIRTRLSRLVSPFWNNEILINRSPFQIYLSVPEPFSHYSGLIEPSETFKNPHYSISGTVAGNGNYILDLVLKDKSSFSKSGCFLTESGDPPTCGPFSIELRVWDRNDLGDLVAETGSTLKEIRADLNAVAGVNIYRDGFRVLPYGEPTDDWLRLDLRRVQNPTLRLSNNQIIGYVLIDSNNNPELRDQSNREGIIESKAFHNLGELVKNTLGILENERYKLRHPKDKGKASGIFVGFDFREVISVFKEKYPNDKEFIDLLEEKSADLETRITNSQDVISRYRRLSTLGQLVDTILHDGRTPVAKINVAASNGKRDTMRALEGKPDLLGSLAQKFSFIENQSSVLTRVFQKIEPFGGRKRGKPLLMNIEKAIEDAFSVLETEISEIGAKVQLPKTSTEVLIEPSEIQLIIINLLQNSLYWLIKTPKETRQIIVQLNKLESGGVEIVFSDSGPGVDPDYRDFIFDPYVSLKPDGVGLGLTIAGEIIHEYYGGELQLIDGGPLDGASFRIIINSRG